MARHPAAALRASRCRGLPSRQLSGLPLRAADRIGAWGSARAAEGTAGDAGEAEAAMSDGRIGAWGSGWAGGGTPPRRCALRGRGVRYMGFWLARCARGPLRRGAACEEANKRFATTDAHGCTRMGHCPSHRHGCSRSVAGFRCERTCRTPAHPCASVCIGGSNILAWPRAARFRLDEIRYGAARCCGATCPLVHGVSSRHKREVGVAAAFGGRRRQWRLCS
jgi:hypothetical protein